MNILQTISVTSKVLFFKTEAEAAKNLTEYRNSLLTSHINELCTRFIKPCNDVIRDQFDFYPNNDGIDIYRIKKWDQDDEYNEHVKSVMTAFKDQPATEQAAVVA
jgi:hypothetical protein